MVQYLGYFVVGGLVVSLTTYYGSKGQGFWAALISMFPSMSLLTFFLLYRIGGKDSVIGYAKNLIHTVPSWILYVCVVAFFCERIGIWWSLGIGVMLYLGVSLGLNQLRL